jgi:hypothetical protein
MTIDVFTQHFADVKDLRYAAKISYILTMYCSYLFAPSSALGGLGGY